MMHLTTVVLILFVTGIAKGLECNAGCNVENGFCDKSGECRCKPGWQGETCDQCVPFPGCLHGTCQKAWQCICEESWVGSLCDQDTSLCSSKSCMGNATCIETGQGGYLCMCPYGYVGEDCHQKNGPCITNGSPCQNGGTCVDVDDYSSCRCPRGFAGDFCEIGTDGCQPNPCQNGGSCTNRGLAFSCSCPDGHAGFTCNDTAIALPVSSGPRGRPHDVGAKPRARPARPLSLAPQHYSLSSHAFHKLLRTPERDVLKVALKETLHGSSSRSSSSSTSVGGQVTHGQLLCFAALALLTCLVILGTTGIVFFGRCEAWMANARYSKLVRQQKEHLLRGAGSGGPEKPEHSVNIILPEKIRLTSFGRHYTPI